MRRCESCSYPLADGGGMGLRDRAVCERCEGEVDGDVTVLPRAAGGGRL